MPQLVTRIGLVVGIFKKIHISRGGAVVFLLMTLSLGAVLWLFEVRYREYAPTLRRAEAAQWVLTTAWLMDRYHEAHGYYCSCGGVEPPCWRILGWMDRPEHLGEYDYELMAHVQHGSYRVEAQLPEGKWTLEQGQAIHWEGVDVEMPWPRSRLQPKEGKDEGLRKNR